jgi:nucleoside-diphosphate-sugar epimerase
MRILFIGGTGIISSACVKLATEQNKDISLFVRGLSEQKRPAPAGIKTFQGDINDEEQAARFFSENPFDIVVNWVAFTPEQVERDMHLLQGKVRQYVFISSASAYQKPVKQLPITEETPLENPYWAYSRNKKACEEALMKAYREVGFPVTIVRPSHTYDKTLLPFEGGYTIVDRMLKGKPVIIHGDGTSLWVLTHHNDFARGFVPLLGNPAAIGEAFHITSDMLLSWNQIYDITAEAFGAKLRAMHIPSEVIARYDSDWGASLLGDKTHSVIFDNSKIKTFVPDFQAVIPFSEGIKEIAKWYQQPKYQVVDQSFSSLIDQIVEDRQ